MAERKDLIISPDEFPSNSFKSKEKTKEKITVEKVEIEGQIKHKKKGFGKKISETLFDEDGKNVGSYIFYDVVVPAIKSLIADTITNGISMFLYGDDRPSSSRVTRDRGKSYVSYNSYYDDDRRRNNRRSLDRRHRASHSYEDVIFSSRSDAEKVLDRLIDIIEEYDQVSVADFYDFVGVDSSYTDRNWGWDNLRDACVSRVRDGYIIELPRTVVLD